MPNITKLKEEMIQNNITNEELASKIGIDISTFYRKLKTNGEAFSVKEAKGVAIALNLSKNQAMDIFFAEELA